ncbi:hypothetical protein AB0F36_33440 [Streptomyces sp. NPDC029080]|uniref:hypothetical protein n=1 Tax=Streptomyces sp. NPDC029080 TaxID=3155017 RepID=UPI0033FA4273
MTVSGWCRTLRAGVFAVACVLLAALGHELMSGVPVPWWAMAAGAAGTGAGGWCLAGRERGHALIVAAVVAAQTALHETFSLAQAHSSSGPAHDMGAMHMGAMHTGAVHVGALHVGSMYMGAAPMESAHMGSAHTGAMPMDAMNMPGTGHAGAGSMPLGGPGLHGAHSMDGTAGLGMFAAHLLAAVLCGLWLAYGERAVFRILRAMAARLVAPLRMLLALPVPQCRPSVRRGDDTGRPPLPRLLLGYAIISRGPPVGAAVA